MTRDELLSLIDRILFGSNPQQSQLKRILLGSKSQQSQQSQQLQYTPAVVPQIQGPVMFDELGNITLSIHSVAQAKLSLADLKLKKKEFSLAKRQIMEKEREIRAGHTDSVRRQVPKVRGGGSFFRTIRTMQTVSRAAERSVLTRNLQPYEVQRSEIEKRVLAIDKAILQIQTYISQNS